MCSFHYTNSLIGDIAMVIYMLSLVLVGRTLGVTPPLPVAPYHELHVMAVQMMNA